MENKTELEKSKPHFIAGLVNYVLDSVVVKTIVKKLSGNISVMAFDKGEGLTEKTSPFDSFAQVIEGDAEIVIDKVSNLVDSGKGILIPSGSSNSIKPNGRFKMILINLKTTDKKLP